MGRTIPIIVDVRKKTTLYKNKCSLARFANLKIDKAACAFYGLPPEYLEDVRKSGGYWNKRKLFHPLLSDGYCHLYGIMIYPFTLANQAIAAPHGRTAKRQRGTDYRFTWDVERKRYRVSAPGGPKAYAKSVAKAMAKWREFMETHPR
jgi:hypothetical protein